MRKRGYLCGATLAAVCLLTGCHHRAFVPAMAPPMAPPADAGPVMVSVPPPTHHSGDVPVTVRSEIPVVKAVKPPRKVTRRTPAQAAVAVNTQSASTAPPATPPAASVNLGQLTSSTDDPTATRDAAASALRRERDRMAGISGPVLAAHSNEIEQARRFLKSAADSWNAADYAGTLTLTTKARVLLDDLLK